MFNDLKGKLETMFQKMAGTYTPTHDERLDQERVKVGGMEIKPGTLGDHIGEISEDDLQNFLEEYDGRAGRINRAWCFNRLDEEEGPDTNFDVVVYRSKLAKCIIKDIVCARQALGLEIDPEFHTVESEPQVGIQAEELTQ